MDTVARILSRISVSGTGFTVHPPLGPPELCSGHKLPGDLALFYDLCGGLEFDGRNDRMEFSILPPSRFRRGNPERGVIDRGSICDAWYFLVDVSDGNYIAIDCSTERLGYCCEAFMFTYANRDFSPILARSFTQLLRSLVEHEGDYFFWREDGFKSLGSMFEK